MSGFNATTLDGSTPPVPLSAAISPGDKTPRPVAGGPEFTDSQGNTLTPVQTYPSQGSSAPLTSVSGSITSVSLLAANVNRKTFFVYNESAATLYLAWGATASLTAYTSQVPPNNLYEMPSTSTWQGAVSGLWSSAVGAARITEVS